MRLPPSWKLVYELVRYAMPVPVRGRGRAPVGCIGRWRNVGGAPGGSTPDETEFDVVRTPPSTGSADCGLDNVRGRE